MQPVQAPAHRKDRPGLPAGSGIRQGAAAEEEDRHAARDLSRLQFAVFIVGFVVCVHLLLWNLRAVLMPFVLSAFLVAAVEPSADILYHMLAGLAPPHRWCCCCCRRHGRQADGGWWESWGQWRQKAQRPRPGRLVPETESEGTPLLAQHRGGASQPPAGEAQEDSDKFWEAVCKMVAVFITISGILLVICGFIVLLFRGALHLQQSWPAYQAGLHRMSKSIDVIAEALAHNSDKAAQRTTELRIRAVYNNVLSVIQDTIYACVSTVVQSISSGLTTLAFVILYVLFWLARPLPMGGHAGTVVRSYIWKKTLTSLCYSFCVTALLLSLGLDLAYFFGMISFFLNYVPEVGALFSIVMPLPVILLDGRLESPVTCAVLSVCGHLVLKLAISNYMEVKLIEQDALMSVHPVWVLLALNYFGFIWGPAGMLVSVPLLAILKGTALSALEEDDDGGATFSSGFMHAVLACLEGKPGLAARHLDTLSSSASRGSGKSSASEASSGPCATGRSRPQAGCAVGFPCTAGESGVMEAYQSTRSGGDSDHTSGSDILPFVCKTPAAEPDPELAVECTTAPQSV